jgi:hypothetical protein
LDNIVETGIGVLIGDANGADRAVQQCFADRRYPAVTVYCSGGNPRNNLGSWPVQDVEVDGKKRDFSFFAAKDKRMAERADYGLMLWDGMSKGTLNDILNSIQVKKTVLVYFSRDHSLHTFTNREQLRDFLSNSSEADKSNVRRMLHDLVALDQQQLTLSL